MDKLTTKEIKKRLEKELTEEEFKIYCSLSQNSINNISKKIEESISISIPLELRTGA
ncbi:hypothetical protein [Clostridium tagluense]|uniref:hypothetical protein n=1 Tax=Clostridium tagluense TaxID=360422 RepID=UPI001CF231C0|nr:hypothetical protein [Clostridium tagluense]MCB2300438.1 hypothetical protein [Clostridium tagluense]